MCGETMKILFQIVLVFIFQISAHANDLSSGGESEGGYSSSNQKEFVAKDGNCPTLLKKWVDDDFTDQTSFFFIPFNSEAKVCQSNVKNYQELLKSRNHSPNFSDSNALGSYLSQKYKGQIHDSYQERYLKDCKALPPEKATAIQTRFYAASARIAAVNSPILDEVAYYDSLLPSSPSILHGVDCSPTFPENSKRCSEYKVKAQSCQANKEKRFEEQVAKTKKNLVMIEDLLRAHRNCVKSITGLSGRAYTPEEKAGVKNCDTFLQVIELKKNETPWIRGESFQKIAIKSGPNPRNKFTTEYNFDDKNIDKAIASQVGANRKALTDTYSNNLENFRCLSGSVKADGKPCDFKKIRTDLSSLPALDSSDYKYKDSKDAEAKTYIDAEACLLDRGEDRSRTQEIVDSSGSGIALTIATLGIGSVASGIRAVNTVSRVGRTAAIVANGALNAALTTEDLKKTYDTCSKETKMVSSLSGKSEVTQENICSDPKSPLSQAREKESDCLVSALLSAPGLLPFAGAVPSLARLARKPAAAANADRAAVDNFITRMSGRENLRAQDLEFAGSLNKEDRLMAAEGILGRNLSQKEKDALFAAHETGGPFSFNGNYTAAEIEEKRALMKAAGFSDRESETLLWKGITGFSRAEMVPLAQKRATEFFGMPVSRTQADAIFTDLETITKPKEVRMKALTDAGFTPTQAQEIMDQKLRSSGTFSSTLKAAAPAVAVKPTPPVAPKPEPVAVPPPTPVPQISPEAELLKQRQTEAAAIKKLIGTEKLYEISGNPKASVKEIEAGIDEQLRRNGYKPNEYSKERAGYVIDSFNEDVAQIYKLKSRLSEAKPGSPDAIKIQESLMAYQARCRSWKTLYIGANYTNTNVISNFNTQISRVCAD